jgi:hypothetical protein
VKYATALSALFLCAVSHAGDLSLRDGAVLRNAEVKGISGKDIVMVKHKGGVGMYSYALFTPESAAVISNLYPKVAATASATPAAVKTPQSARADASNSQSAPNALATALSTNERLFNAARVCLNAAINRERDALVAEQQGNAERIKLEQDVDRLQKWVNGLERELITHSCFRAQTKPCSQGARDPRVAWNQEQTVLNQALGDKREELAYAETQLKKFVEPQEKELRAFDVDAYRRQQALNRVFDEHVVRIKMRGELLTAKSMADDFDCIQ